MLNEKLLMADIVIGDISMVYSHKTSKWRIDEPIKRRINGLVLFTEGTVIYDIGGEKVEISRGDILLLPRGVPYCGKRLTETISFIVVDFEALPRDAVAESPFPYKATPSSYEEVKNIFTKMLMLWEKPIVGARTEIRACVYHILTKMLRLGAGENRSVSQNLASAMEYIANNYRDKDLSVSGVAKEVFVSTSHLRRLFIEALGVPPTEYIINYRLDKAAIMLTNESLPVGKVAEECGFSSLYYFSRLFKKKKGVTPSKFVM